MMYMEEVKRIPYGVSNFVDVIEQNQYYVDKTMYLPLLEDQPSNLFLIRPRRFGKSIFLSMMSAYYDIARKNDFEHLFGNLWIGSHPTRLHGRTEKTRDMGSALPIKYKIWFYARLRLCQHQAGTSL